MPPTLNRGAALGICVFCGNDDLPRTKGGAPSRSRRWHPACKKRFQFLTDPFWQRLEVWKRDRGVCCDCGAETTPSILKQHIEDCFASDALGLLRGYGFGPWELDHDVPLWSVDHLPDRERLRFFELENMKTRCVPCHKRKTAREAVGRAKEKRIVKKSTQPKKASLIKSRPFQSAKNRETKKKKIAKKQVKRRALFR